LVLIISFFDYFLIYHFLAGKVKWEGKKNLGERINMNQNNKGENSIPKSYVPVQTTLKELTLKALLPGLLFAVILGAANAYVGLKAGMTVSATFPAAVIAMAILRPFKGSILEENITRTTAAVGEALVAGAIFTLPAFFMSGVWQSLHYWNSTLIMLIGGVIGVLFVILLRRPLCEDATLPFPESVACSEIVKAGQKGQTGAKYVFGAMGFAALLEFFKNDNGIKLFADSFTQFIPFKLSTIRWLKEGKQIGASMLHKGGLILQSPLISPALMGVGFIIGPELAALNWSGGLLAWLVLVPLALFMNPGLEQVAANNQMSLVDLGTAVWTSTIRPIAVGTMLVGAVYTLWKMRKSLFRGIYRGFEDMKRARAGHIELNRLQQDIPPLWIVFGIIGMIIPMFFLYQYFCQSWLTAVVATLIMISTGFLFSAVGGYLVGLIGGSNQPISGLALSTLIIAALVMVVMGIKGLVGVAAVLVTAAVICCATSMAGDMIQDLKVGQIIGGTPWKMETVVIISVIVVSFFLYYPIQWLHLGTPGGLGGENLPAPQAGLMAMMAKGIVGGEMPWSLVLIGIALGIGLVLIKSPSPMLIAVGMYLPFQTSSAIFIGGLIKWIFDFMVKAKKFNEIEKNSCENVGTLIASGMVAGEAIIGVILAALYVFKEKFPYLTEIFKVRGENPYVGLLVIPLIAFILIYFPLKSRKEYVNPFKLE
jgi:putative OPT family oligopeptide transporter